MTTTRSAATPDACGSHARRWRKLLLSAGLLAALAVPSFVVLPDHARASHDTTVVERALPASIELVEVPFHSQEEYQCGPASLAMVLQYYGAPVDQDEITRALYIPSVRGTLNLDLEFYARRRGFQARSFEGTLARAKEEIRQGRPLIVFQDLGAALWPVPHFAVLLGYDDRAGAVVLHSGTTPYRVLSYAEFERSWVARRSWALLIVPGQ